MTDPDLYDRAIHLATVAYHAAMADDLIGLSAALNAITDECGAEGVTTALIAWCDTYIQHASGGQPFGAAKVYGWDDKTDRLMTDTSGLPASDQWGIRLVSARASMDLAAFTAALQELNDMPDGPPDFQRGNAVYQLLNALGTAVTTLPYGYGARMMGGSLS